MWAILLFLLTSGARADFDSGTGTNLSAEQLSVIGNTIAASLRFRSVEGARAKPAPGTVSVGVLGGAMSASKLRETFPENDVPSLAPEGDLVLVAQFTRDVAVEAGFVPTLSVGSNKFSKIGAGLKWTATRLLLGEASKLELAFRGSFTRPALIMTTGDTELAYAGTIAGGNATLSYPFGVFEPYVGAGYFTSSGQLSGSGSGDFYGTPISLSQSSVALSSSSPAFFGGFALQAGVVGLGIEAESSFGAVSGLCKFSFQLGPFSSEDRGATATALGK